MEKADLQAFDGTDQDHVAVKKYVYCWLPE